MRSLLFIVCAVLARQAAAPVAPFATAVTGAVVSLPATGSGEVLTALNFGTVPRGEKGAILIRVLYDSPETVSGLQFSVLAGDKGEDFALLAPENNNLPIRTAELSLVMEFRPKTTGTHRAQIEVYGGGKLLTRIPVTGLAQ